MYDTRVIPIVGCPLPRTSFSDSCRTPFYSIALPSPLPFFYQDPLRDTLKYIPNKPRVRLKTRLVLLLCSPLSRFLGLDNFHSPLLYVFPAVNCECYMKVITPRGKNAMLLNVRVVNYGLEFFYLYLAI